MPTLHKNITASADIHNPNGFLMLIMEMYLGEMKKES